MQHLMKRIARYTRANTMSLFYRPFAVAALLVLSPALLAAQDETDEETFRQSADAGTDRLQLPELKVTARKSTEYAKDVPLSITVIDVEDIEAKGLLSTEEVLRNAPGVNVNTSGGANVSSIYIRGVGALYPMSMDDASVAVSVNGSPLNPRHLSLGNLDIEQVEILKGPQGTLFGGLGVAGAVNITTAKPTRHVEGYARGEIGEEGQHLLAAAVGGPLSKQLSGRLAVQHSGYDYPITNVQTGAPVSEPDLLGLRGSLQWDFNAQTSALLSVDYHKSRHMGENIVLRPYEDNPRTSVTPGIYDYSQKTLERYALQIDHRLVDSQLTAITTYSDADNISPVVFDRLITEALFGSPSEYWRDQRSTEQVITQDLRLASLPEADIFWVVGLSALYSDRTYDHPRVGGAGFTVYPGTAQYRDFNTRRYGLYGEVTLPVANAWKATAGLRHTWDRKTYDATYVAAGVSTPDNDEVKDNFTTGRLGLAYEITPDANVYATVSRGYNPGGFQDYAEYVGDAAYKAGSVHAGELGIKSEFLNRRLRIDASVFVTEVDDNYLIDSDGVSSLVVNADTRSVGSELALSAQLSESLTLSGTLSYIDATIESDADTGFGPVKSGNSVPDVPEWSAGFSAVYSKALPGNAYLSAPTLNARLDYVYSGERPADVQNNFDLDEYHDVDMRLGIANNGMELFIWGRNLVGDHYDLYGFFGGSGGVTYGAPSRGRSLGAGFSYTF